MPRRQNKKKNTSTAVANVNDAKKNVHARPNCDDLTQFKEGRRYFGEYRCPTCKRGWKSANSWLNYGQECIKCRIYVLPKLRPLRRRRKREGDRKPHQDDLCQKCCTLGFPCTTLLD